ncbi:ABC transporter permease [Arthrobacter zhaoguopingii]|uniref:ABC transporter permease n=1 Tax=Arthrobacter zhaoguopingii TaxID=2681491 RepID=UPI001FEFE813|nr:ABC transporter permease [Arthrobacter zhaoguopingii]
MTMALVPLQILGILAVIRAAGRPDLEVVAVVAPGLMATWQNALYVVGDLVTKDRDSGRLEMLAAARAPYFTYLLGRTAAVSGYSVVVFALSLALGGFVLGVPVTVDTLPLTALMVVATATATGCVGILLAVFFVRTHNPHTYQNALGYPIFILGGVLVPIDVYPDWLEALGHLVYLSWAADLLRSLLIGEIPSNWWAAVVVVLGTALVAGGLGSWVISRAVDRLRVEGAFDGI